MEVKDLSEDRDCSNTIYITESNKAMVDLGEVIKINSLVEDSWENRVIDFVNNNSVPYSSYSRLTHYEGFFDLMKIFDISSEVNPKVTEKTKELLTGAIKKEMMYILYKYYDLSTKGNYSIKSTESPEKQASLLAETFIRKNIGDFINYYYVDYETDLLNTLFGIDLLKLSEKSLVEFKLKINNSFSDFDELIDNFSYLEFRETENYRKCVDFIYTCDKNRNFEHFFGKGLYKDIIKDIYKKALESNGENVSEFYILNKGTVRTPDIHYEMNITLEDLVKYLNVSSPKDFPADLKEEILKNHIYDLTLITKESLNIE